MKEETYYVRPVTFKGWGIYKIIAENTAEVIYTNLDKNECYKKLDELKKSK